MEKNKLAASPSQPHDRHRELAGSSSATITEHYKRAIESLCDGQYEGLAASLRLRLVVQLQQDLCKVATRDELDTLRLQIACDWRADC